MNTETLLREFFDLLKSAGPDLIHAIGDLVSAHKSGGDLSAAERKVEAEAAKRFLEI